MSVPSCFALEVPLVMNTRDTVSSFFSPTSITHTQSLLIYTAVHQILISKLYTSSNQSAFRFLCLFACIIFSTQAFSSLLLFLPSERVTFSNLFVHTPYYINFYASISYWYLYISVLHSSFCFFILTLFCSVSLLHLLQYSIFVARNLFRMCSVSTHNSDNGVYCLGTYIFYPVQFFICATLVLCFVLTLSLNWIPRPISQTYNRCYRHIQL